MSDPSAESDRLRRRVAELEASEARYRGLFERERDSRTDDAGELLAALLENTPDYVFFKDRDRRFVRASRSFEQLLDRKPGEIIGRRDEELFPPDIAADTVADDRRIIEEGVPVLNKVEGGVVAKGVERWVSTTKLPWRRPDGSIRGLYGISKDITAIKRAQKLVGDSEQRLRQVIDSLFGFVGLYTVEGVLLEANRAPLEAAGLEASDVLGKRFWETYWWNYSPAVQERLRRVMARAAAGEVVRYEERVRIRDGALIDVDLSFGPMRDAGGAIDGIIGFGVDVTERTEVERALRENEERLRLALEASGQGTWELDLRTMTTSLDAQHARMLGYQSEELSDREQAEYVEHMHPDDRDVTAATFQAYLAGDLPKYEHEFRLRTKAGGWKWILSTGVIVERGTDGRPQRMIGTHTDIDGRKRTEEEIRSLNTDLEIRVTRRTAELEALNEELEAFAFSVSHDLRAPLRAVNGFSTIIRKDHGQQLDPTALALLERIEVAAARMGRLIDDMLGLAQATQRVMALQTIDLDAEVGTLVDELRSRHRHACPAFDVRELGMAVADPTVVRAVVRELLENARKYAAGRADPRVEIGVVPDANERTYFVRDNGVGFPAEQAHKLFTPFQRLHEDSEFDGRGMGLAMVRRALSRTGGRIWAESTPGAGATFFFTIAAASDPVDFADRNGASDDG